MDVTWVLIKCIIFTQQSGQLDLKHFDPEFVREPVPGKLKSFLSIFGFVLVLTIKVREFLTS